ncbi:MAG: fumarylacetoacetate hydrolase family protein, partial [Pseudomonadota bacterium]
MTHETFVFAPAPPPTLAIAGSTARVPIHRIFCVGRNYADHAAEMGTQVEKAAPWYFTKSVQHALSNPDRAPMPKATKEYHYEVEWAVVLKSGGA